MLLQQEQCSATPTHGRVTLQDFASLCKAPRGSLCGSNSDCDESRSFGHGRSAWPGQHWAAPGWPSPLGPFTPLIMTNGKKQVSRWRMFLWRTFPGLMQVLPWNPLSSWTLFYVYSAFKMCFKCKSTSPNTLIKESTPKKNSKNPQFISYNVAAASKFKLV